MPEVFAALVKGGSDLLGGYLQDKSAKKAFNKQQALNAAGAKRAVSALNFGTSLTGSAIKAANASRLAGFAGARKALDLGATAARQTVLGQGKVDQANLEQSAVSQGLLGTSTGAQAFAGVGDRTTAHLSAIDQSLAQSFADLGLQEASTKAAGEMNLADLQQQKAEAMFNLVQSADPNAVASKHKKHKSHGITKFYHADTYGF